MIINDNILCYVTNDKIEIIISQTTAPFSDRNVRIQLFKTSFQTHFQLIQFNSNQDKISKAFQSELKKLQSKVFCSCIQSRCSIMSLQWHCGTSQPGSHTNTS